jgi:hypothetical protein
MDKYASHGWMFADTYNGLIMALGKQFERLSSRELASFCSSLGKSGLRQEDIIAETIKRIEERVEPPADHPQDKFFASFNGVILPIFKSMIDMNFQDKELFAKLISDDFNKKCVFGSLTFFEQAKRAKVNSEIILSSIFRGHLDLTNPSFKELVKIEN